MKTKLFKKLLPILLSILIIGTSIPLQVFASTDKATKINSQTLFEASTLDTLELNIKTLPTITVTGSEKYKINNASKTRPVYNDEVVNSNVIFDCGFDKKLDATITLNFSNCGTLNSKAIDMKLIYSDIYSAPKQNITGYDTKTFWWTAYGTPSQQTNTNEWFEVGFSRYNVDISFYYHNSNTPIKLENAYFTLYSEDASKDDNGNVIYSEASSSANVASNVFLYENTSIAYKASVTHFKKNYKDVYYGTSSGSTNAKTKNAVSYQYKNRISINLDMMMMYSHKTMGYHFNFVPLTACVPDEPVKTVSKETATGNTNIEYSIKQTLPTAYDKNFKLKSLKLADILEKPIDYVSAKVFDEKGKDITKTAGTLSYDENTKKVMFEFNADYLKGISYNGQTVTMKINVVTKEKISVKEINNKSISNFNDTDVLYSNTVQTNIYYPVTVNYLDEQGNKLAESSTKDYFVGDNYSTKAKTISNYVLTEIPSNADGAVINSAITVDYIYRLKNTNIIVNYIDTEGNPLAESDLINGKVFDEYTTEAKDIYGYELTAVPNNATGEMTEDEIVVNYIYSLKPASVIVNYKTETGNKLAESVTLDGKIFDKYDTEQKEFYGYELIAVPDNATGEMTEDVITVDYIYRLKGTKVIVNYIDTEKNPLAESDTINGKVLDEYTTEAKNIYGYELTAVPDNATGEMTEDEIVVNYIYSLKPASVVVNYKTETGDKLTESITIDGKVFDEYNTEQMEFYGYELIALPNNATGEMTEDVITVDYIYRLKGATVTVNYIDIEGNPLAESDTINGKVFDEYTTKAKDIQYYSLTAVPDNANGTMTDKGIIVNYVYSRNESTVTINFLEKDTDTKLATTVIYKFLQGNEYDVNNETDKSIQYYKIVSVKGDEVKGIVDSDKIINVYYEKRKSNIVINFIDWVTKEVISPLINKTQEQGTDYDVTTDATKKIEYYTYYNSEGNMSGVLEQDENINSYYVRNENNITIKYVEKGTDKELANTVTQRVHQGTDYNVSDLANKEIDCYNLDSIEGLTKGFITEDIEIIVYYTTKATDVVVKYVDTEGKALTKKTVIDGKVFDNYTTENKTFYGYELTEMPDNANGTMTENTITVIYVYRLKDTSVVVNYKTETGDKLADSITFDGKVFDKYNTEQMEFYGYELIAVPDNATGEMKEDIITVDYIYRLKNTNVIVNYIDTEGKSLAESDLFTGKVFDEYTTEAKNIYGYELTEVPDNATGEMTEDEIVVDYIYSLKPASVIVNYKTETGDKLADSITLDGKVFDKYNTEQMEFYGYELIALPDNATGEMAEDVITVDYIYRLKDAKVIVKYVDTENKELEKSIIIEGKVFDEYVTEQKDIKDYSFVKATPNIAGTMTEDTIEVIYTYTRTILNEIKVIETEKPVEQTNKDTPVEIEKVDTGDTNNTVKLAVMSGLLVVFIIIFVLVSKKMKKK